MFEDPGYNKNHDATDAIRYAASQYEYSNKVYSLNGSLSSLTIDNIRKIISKTNYGFKVTVDDIVKEFESSYKMYKESIKHGSFAINPEAYYDRLISSVTCEDLVDTYVAEHVRINKNIERVKAEYGDDFTIKGDRLFRPGYGYVRTVNSKKTTVTDHFGRSKTVEKKYYTYDPERF